MLLFPFCLASAALAWREAAIGAELQHLLRLPFTVTRPMVAALIVGGGLSLLVAHYLMARAAVVLAARRRRRGGDTGRPAGP